MQRFLLRDCLGWGVLLWSAGYLLGFLFFPLVPAQTIGWYVMPLGLALTGAILWKWVRVDTLGSAVFLGVSWCAIAILLDYVFIVQLLKPADGYYKLDVFLYYLSALTLPPLAALMRRRIRQTSA